jgi:hypothetical protein
MKKYLIAGAITISVLIGGIYTSYRIIDNVASYNKPDVEEDVGPSVVSQISPELITEETTEQVIEQEIKEQEIIEQTSTIGGVQFDTKLNENSVESEVVDVMHKMTHQKVRSEDKWGAIPLSEDTVTQVYEIVSKSNFGNKNGLMAILEKWKKGNFENVDTDHNYFWELQGGTVGQAYGKLTPNEEEEFIKNNFPNLFN